ncbi:PREDICTED: uncharacterized protein LOC108782923 [Cyphomyrmex costatus]|uniref:uncharacterized protein LOC108782923 n=1 Tax=Cyphomyrmex costatus TaxID=456900 RepID=UPI00085221D2|nr:PREDICTED: uncharacterized protein LOC108782923 [Cyphomyrmex costatus]
MREVRSLDAWVEENLEAAYQKQATYYNRHRRNRVFSVGDLVWRRRNTLSSAAQGIAAKLAPKFQGPFRITCVVSSLVYELVALDGTAAGRVHVKDLKPYIAPD